MASLFPDLDIGTQKAHLVGKPVGEVFRTIYAKKLWGGRFGFGAYSGNGSRNKEIIAPYITAVRDFLKSHGRPSVVDVGCGDFNVGSQLVDFSSKYIGCDIVDFVIAQNRRRFPDVEFRTVNAVEDDLPDAEVVIIRQVLQHLSNAQVAKILPKLGKYKYAIITEHIPGKPIFVPNLDQEAGPEDRTSIGSGLVLTEPPFNLQPKSSHILCEVPEFGGLIRTIVFEF